jgi:bifunctional N-acetylglucosamine-1-phosphate-uridyltransferase/glucosamine-1-phosphate-acetyltransferase GlmU-like protein
VGSYRAVTIHETAQIAQTAIIGAPFRPLLDERQLAVDHETSVEANTWIGNYTIIGQGVTIGAGSILEEFVQVQAGTVLGSHVLVTSRSQIGMGVKVGDDSMVRGHVGDSCRIGRGCRIAGELIHRQLNPSIPWDDPAAEESAPIVADGAFVGWRAVIIGGVNVGEGAYICAGSLITKDVPAGYIACNRNVIMTPDEWQGALGKSPFFAQAGRPRASGMRMRSWRVPRRGSRYGSS